MKVTKWNEKAKGNIYTGNGSWAYLMDGNIKSSGSDIQRGLQKAEVDRLTEMGQWWRKMSRELQGPGVRSQLGSSPAGTSKKLCLLGDAYDGQFFDAVFKVSISGRLPLICRYCTSILD
jgi:hypothetical protein